MLYRINQKNKVDTLSVERIKTRKVKPENENKIIKRQARYEKCEKKERKHQMEIMDIVSRNCTFADGWRCPNT